MINPFSDTQAVKNNQFFFGYKDQKKEIKSKILQSQESTSSTNIAILGSSCTGKTSFLNFIKNYCDEKNIPCIKRVRAKSYQPPFELYEAIFENLLDVYMDLVNKMEDSSNVEAMRLEYKLFRQAQSDNYGDASKDYEFIHDCFCYKLDKNLIINTNTLIKQFRHFYSLISSLIQAQPGFKIPILIDDFHNIVGLDEQERDVLDEDEYNDKKIALRDAIEVLRNEVIPELDSQFQFIIAMYPGLLQRQKFDYIDKLITRSFMNGKVNVNKFNDEEETREMLLGLLKGSKTPWEEYFVSKKIPVENIAAYNGKPELELKIDTSSKKYFRYCSRIIENELQKISRMVYNISGGAPHIMKLLFSSIYDEAMELPIANVQMIDLSPSEWRKVYKKVSYSGQSNPLVSKYAKYSLERKFLLSLFLWNSDFTFKHIIKIVSLFSIFTNIQNKLKKNKDLDSENENFYSDINNLSKNIDFNITSLLNEDNFKSACKQFELDELIKYDDSDSIKTKILLDSVTLGYIHNDVYSEGIPEINTVSLSDNFYFDKKIKNQLDEVIVKKFIEKFIAQENDSAFESVFLINDNSKINSSRPIHEYLDFFLTSNDDFPEQAINDPEFGFRPIIRLLENLRLSPKDEDDICCANFFKVQISDRFYDIAINKSFKTVDDFKEWSNKIEHSINFLNKNKIFKDNEISFSRVSSKYFKGTDFNSLSLKLIKMKSLYDFLDYKTLWSFDLHDQALDNCISKIKKNIKDGMENSSEFIENLSHGMYLVLTRNSNKKLKEFNADFQAYIYNIWEKNKINSFLMNWNYYLFKYMQCMEKSEDGSLKVKASFHEKNQTVFKDMMSLHKAVINKNKSVPFLTCLYVNSKGNLSEVSDDSTPFFFANVVALSLAQLAANKTIQISKDHMAFMGDILEQYGFKSKFIREKVANLASSKVKTTNPKK